MDRVYISGPYTQGDVAVNVRKAIDAADVLAKAGFVVICPHLTHFWHLVYQHDHEFWMTQDLELVTICDMVIRLPGESAGADRECALAEEYGIPVRTLEDLAWRLVEKRGK